MSYDVALTGRSISDSLIKQSAVAVSSEQRRRWGAHISETVTVGAATFLLLSNGAEEGIKTIHII